MKRYFIYGFLTILIITLNFAFIIVLVTDDVRINYKVLFLLWVVVLLAAGGLAYLEKTRKRRKRIAAATPKPSQTEDYLKHPEDKFQNSRIYKNKCIKKVKIQLPEDLTSKVKQGFFGGYVNNEDYANETVQAVYTSQGQLLGYVNKKEEQLCENLELLYDEPLICWGKIRWDDHEKKFIAKIYIPVLYSEPEINKFKKMVALKEELVPMQQEPEDPDVYDFLRKAESFYYLQQSMVIPPSLDHEIDNELIFRLGRDLHAKHQWRELAQLKEYPVLISRLNPPEKKEMASFLKKAENKTGT